MYHSQLKCKSSFFFSILRWVFEGRTLKYRYFPIRMLAGRRDISEKPFEALYQHRKNPYSATLFGEQKPTKNKNAKSKRSSAGKSKNCLWWLHLNDFRLFCLGSRDLTVCKQIKLAHGNPVPYSGRSVRRILGPPRLLSATD